MKATTSYFFFACAIAVGIAVVFGPGIHNQLVFDDGRLTDGTVFGQYGSLIQLKARLLSYGSFVWVQGILGDGWWKQRLVNIALHMGTAATLYALAVQLLQRTQWSTAPAQASGTGTSPLPTSFSWAAGLGVALWALNPVAVYAVAYLIQRSILMATLFVSLACLGFVRGLASGRQAWFVLALLSYLAAVASKEHAITAILLAVPLFVFVKRPPMRQVIQLAAGSALVLILIAAVFFSLFGSIIGTVFDENSRAFALQLEQLKPGIGSQLYPLSIINQAALFFYYGFLWLLPYVGWMSIDLRPAFPLSWLGPELLGALAWLALLGWSLWLVVRRSDVWGLLGLCLLMPLLMFTTEFSTVWIQDPFVLYRSYLWSVAWPTLFALPLVLRGTRQMYAVVAIVMALFAGLAFERVNSLRTSSVAWTDAAAKIDSNAGPNAVGRWRPFTALGEIAMEQSDWDKALRLLGQAEALGEPLGSARFNIGVSQQQLRQHDKALESFAAAQAKGFGEAALYFHQGESQFALRQFAPAFDSYSAALKRPQAADAEEFTRLRQAEAATGSQKFDDAITSYTQLLRLQPAKQRYIVGLSMAHVGKKNYQAALGLLNPTLAAQPSGPAYYARALTYYYMGNRAASEQDLGFALRLEPNNPGYRQLQAMLGATPNAGAQKALNLTKKATQ